MEVGDIVFNSWLEIRPASLICVGLSSPLPPFKMRLNIYRRLLTSRSCPKRGSHQLSTQSPGSPSLFQSENSLYSKSSWFVDQVSHLGQKQEIASWRPHPLLAHAQL